VLVKASKSVGLWEVAEHLTDPGAATARGGAAHNGAGQDTEAAG
jgi:UDP-N-acetylmuramoyl-tripeptide--D-alanyl-D-alanine ligase